MLWLSNMGPDQGRTCCSGENCSGWCSSRSNAGGRLIATKTVTKTLLVAFCAITSWSAGPSVVFADAPSDGSLSIETSVRGVIGAKRKSPDLPRIQVAQAGNDTKKAFEAAKELGTRDAWNAFLRSYPNGFYADLARAYVKRLDGSPRAGTSSAPSRPSSGNAGGSSFATVTRVVYGTGAFSKTSSKSWIEHRDAGAVVRYKQTRTSRHGIELLDRSGTVYVTLDVTDKSIWRKEGRGLPKKIHAIKKIERN